jgi:hypothetical protein
MTKRKARTVGELLVVRLGWRRAFGVSGLITTWALHRALYDEEPTALQLSDDIGKSRSQVYRWLEDFHAALPMYETPGVLLDRTRAPKLVTSATVMRLRVAA